MFLTLLMMLTSMIIMLLILLMLNIVSKKTFSDKEKNSPFECGFDPKTSARMPFSLQFFLIAIIFLIFDVEIILIMPVIKIMDSSNYLSTTMTLNLFMIILIGGLFHEWNQGALTWLK